MIVKFDAQTPQNMVWSVDTTKNPVVISYSGFLLSLDELRKISEAASAALEFAEKVQFDIDYDADVVVKTAGEQVKDYDEDIPF